jgi:hypothetical protein
MMFYLCIYRPGDIVLSRVISFGDASAGYLLTTGDYKKLIIQEHLLTKEHNNYK